MTTVPRPLVLLVERLVLAAWAVVEALAGATVLLVEARAAARSRARRRSPGARGGPVPCAAGERPSRVSLV